MANAADVNKLISIYEDLQVLMKSHLDMGNLIEEQNDGFDQIEIVSESVLEICERIEQCLQGQDVRAQCCCPKI